MRILGSLILSAAVVLAGFYAAEIIKKRCLLLDECVNFIRYVSSLITYSDESLIKIISSAARSDDFELLMFLSHFDFTDQAADFESEWCKCIDKYNKSPLFKKDINSLLKRFGSKLGKTDTADQKELCKYYENQFVYLLDSANKSKEEYMKLFRISGFTAGVILFIFVV